MISDLLSFVTHCLFWFPFLRMQGTKVSWWYFLHSKSTWSIKFFNSRDLLSKVLESIDIAKEIADGLRVIFDFNLPGVLLYGSHGEVKQYNEVMKPGKVQKQRTLITKPNLSIPTKIMMPPASVRNRRQSSTTIDQALQGKVHTFWEGH